MPDDRVRLSVSTAPWANRLLLDENLSERVQPMGA